MDGAYAPSARPAGFAAMTSRLWGRLAQWTGLASASGPVRETPGDTALEAPDADLPAWAAENCFTPLDRVGSSLWATADALRVLAATPSAARLAFDPGRLPPPYAYAVHALGTTFDPATQTWHSDDLPPGDLFTGRPSGRTVVFHGRLLPGVSHLPVPLYGRLRRPPQVVDGPQGALEPLSDPPDRPRVLVRHTAPVTVRYEVELLEPPVLTAREARIDAPPLTVPTLSRAQLPWRVRRWIDQLEREHRTPWEAAIAAQAFVQRFYRYDERFKDRPEVRRRRAALPRGAGNHCLALLHASSDGDVLGRGICYELNVMVVELLRHLGIPSLVATGWVLDEGRIDRPDHLFALALVSSPTGRGVLPLDAAVGDHGPRRPLGGWDQTGAAGLEPHPTGPHRVPGIEPARVPGIEPTRVPGIEPSRPPVPGFAGPWSIAPAGKVRDDLEDHLASLRAAERVRLEEDAVVLERAIRLICAVQDVEEPSILEALRAPGVVPADRVFRLRLEAERLLRDPERVGTLVRLLRGEFQQMMAVPPEVQELVKLGLARVVTAPVYQARPVAEE
jgi:transglutaminase-like putative cysteine protease